MRMSVPCTTVPAPGLRTTRTMPQTRHGSLCPPTHLYARTRVHARSRRPIIPRLPPPWTAYAPRGQCHAHCLLAHLTHPHARGHDVPSSSHAMPLCLPYGAIPSPPHHPQKLRPSPLLLRHPSDSSLPVHRHVQSRGQKCRKPASTLTTSEDGGSAIAASRTVRTPRRRQRSGRRSRSPGSKPRRRGCSAGRATSSHA